jgi:glycosyltransferase involved in cell wall biosynthesis
VRVLFVSPNVPWPPDSGGRIRTFELLKALGSQCDLELWCVAEPRDLEEAHLELENVVKAVQIFPRSELPWHLRHLRTKPERWFHSQALIAALERRVRVDPPDVLHADELLLARSLPVDFAERTVIHHHKLDLELAQHLESDGAAPAYVRMKRRLQTRLTARLERFAAEHFKRHVVCSPEDRALLAGRYADLRIASVPSGFDAERFKPNPAVERVPNELLFLGTLSYEPNLDGLEWFAANVWDDLRQRHPELVLRIVGREPGRRAHALLRPGMQLVGPVEDPLPDLWRASALLVPLRIGGGTRLKITEALGAGTPVLSTTIGAEGLGLEDQRHLLLADDAPSFAAAVERLVTDPGLGARLATAGRSFALEHLSWPVLGKRLQRAWEGQRSRAQGV